MIDLRTVRKLSDRYQTTVDNVMKEYFQHVFLSYLYRQKGADSFLFKGGTALRVIWQSPRFSEDLNFTGVKVTIQRIESILERTLAQVEQEGIVVAIDEAKKTSGGYLAILYFEAEGSRYEIQLEISLRQDDKAIGEISLIHSDFLPPFTLIHLDERTLVKEKVNAVLTRAKARDFYDLYFILRSRMVFKEVFGEDGTFRIKLLRAIEQGKLDFKTELKRFLPTSQHNLLKNFEAVLSREIERNLPGN